MMKLISHLAERCVEWLMVIALALIVILVFSNVVARYGFGSGFAGAEELSLLLFLWLVFLGSILALRQRAHLGMELVQALLPRSIRRVCAVISHCLILYVLWLFFDGSWIQTKIGMENYSTVLHYPNALKAASGLFCAGSMLIIVGLNLVRILINSPNAHIPGDPQPIDEAPSAPATPPNGATSSTAQDARL
jgi:TRAP-type C4-dicarboxylate transport system permease small subunit